MGLFDKLKKTFTDAKNQVAPAPQPQYSAPPASHEHDTDDDDDDRGGHHHVNHNVPPQHGNFDLAGFNPSDEDAFFNAVLHMESEGQFGGTDQSRAEIMHRFGIRDHSHWLVVKESVYSVLARHYGSYEEVSQREMNWRSGQMQRHMQQQVSNMAAGGGFTPVEGVSLQAWAAMNASIVSGANIDDLLKGAGIDRARWDRVSAEWNARMARDTTFAITTVYGNAFQAASQGRFANYAREAAAARAANRELALEPPMSHEQYWEILYEQSYAAQQGRDPVEALRQAGLTIVDWTDLSTYMGYHLMRDAGRNWAHYNAIHERVAAKLAVKYPGVKADVDISF